MVIEKKFIYAAIFVIFDIICNFHFKLGDKRYLLSGSRFCTDFFSCIRNFLWLSKKKYSKTEE